MSYEAIFAILADMRRRLTLILGLVLVFLAVAGIFLRDRLQPARAGLLIETTPQATVYINDEQAGTTPYEETRSPGEISLRLVPITAEEPLSTWETRVTLTEGIKTAVKRDFGATQALSSGEILSFERIPGNSAGLTIVSSPDSSQVSIDGQIRGFTPSRIDSVSLGEHEIKVFQPGFRERIIKARTEPGYRLTVVAMLAQSEEEAEEEEVEEKLEEEIDFSQYSLQVLNGSGVSGEAATVGGILEEEGFTEISTGNAPTFDYTDTQVQLKEDTPEQVFEAIRKALTEYTVVKGDILEEDSEYDAVVIAGTRKS